MLLLLLLVAIVVLLFSVSSFLTTRVDVRLRCSAALAEGHGATSAPAPALARRCLATIRRTTGAASTAAGSTASSFSLPGPAPSLAPLVVAGWLRGAGRSGPSARLSLLCGGARQLLPSDVDGRRRERHAKTTRASASYGGGPWLSGTVELPPRGSAFHVRCRTHGRARRWWFWSVEARVAFEERGGGGGEGAGGAACYRADVDALLGAVPRVFQGAARAAAEQLVQRLARDLSTKLRGAG
jgi:hypothetical protein